MDIDETSPTSKLILLGDLFMALGTVSSDDNSSDWEQTNARDVESQNAGLYVTIDFSFIKLQRPADVRLPLHRSS